MSTILVADDNSNIHKMVELALKDQGHKIEKVGNGEHAVRRIAEIHPDLVLADIFMPVRNGYEVCEFVKTNPDYAQIPVVLLQGKFDPLDEREMKRVGADGLLMKPFVPPDPLVTMVRTLLEESAGRRAPAPAAAPALEDTAEMSAVEMAALTGTPPPPEPDFPDYAAPAPRFEIRGDDRPLAFGDLLEPRAEKGLRETSGWGFQASSMAGMDFEERAAEAREEAPSWGGILEEPRRPSPDEAPLKVEFAGVPEPMELIPETPEPSTPSAAEAGPLPELATSLDEWIASGPPTIPAPPEPARDLEPAPLPPLAEEAPRPQHPYAPPRFEPMAPPASHADAVPAEAATAPESTRAAEVSVLTPPPVDPAVVEAVVEKVMARLQPQLVEHLRREIVRPLAEALLQKEVEK